MYIVCNYYYVNIKKKTTNVFISSYYDLSLFNFNVNYFNFVQ